MNRKELESSSRELSRKYKLMREQMQLAAFQSELELMPLNLYYCHIAGIGKRQKEDEIAVDQMLSEILVGLNTLNAPLSMIILGHNEGISVYIGTANGYDEAIFSHLSAVIPSLIIEKNDNDRFNIYDLNGLFNANGLRVDEFYYSGVLKGNPGKENTDYLKQTPIDTVIKGMKGSTWVYGIFAQPQRTAGIRNDEWMIQSSICSGLSDVSYAESDNRENITHSKNYPHVQAYAEKIEQFIEKTQEELNFGGWLTTVVYATVKQQDAAVLGSLLSGAFSDTDSRPEPLHAIEFLKPVGFRSGILQASHNAFFPDLSYPVLSNYYSSIELARLFALPQKDTIGYGVTDVVDFDIAQTQKGNLSVGKIMDRYHKTNTDYAIDINSLNRHCLIVGITGGGKTNTTKSLLYQIRKHHQVPIMVIEPTKKEYWELYKMGFDDLKIYSIGSFEPNAVSFKINPFERIGTISLQSHIDYVFSAFKASFIMYPPMPYVLERAIYSIYEDYGWDVSANINRNGYDYYPTIEDLYYKIPVIVTEMGYDQKMRNDLIGSLQARINSLRIGTKGQVLNVKRSYDIRSILEGNTVIELEDIGDDDTKAFIISMIMIQLAELRRQQPDSQNALRHILLLEEAHRLLKNVQSGTGENADPRGAAVEFFCNLLAELRSKGQGFIIADQIPSKLAIDTVKNTNLKIVHRTVTEEDRVLMGGSMHMTAEQIDALASFGQGVAAVYSEGDNHPKCICSPYAGDHISAERKALSRESVLAMVADQSRLFLNRSEYESQTGLSVYTLNLNAFFKYNYKRALDYINISAFNDFVKINDPHKTGSLIPKEIDLGVRALIEQSGTAYRQAFTPAQFRACIKINLFDVWRFSEKQKSRFLKKILFD